jgi:predicted metal-dependent phosphoesterase TrpH
VIDLHLHTLASDGRSTPEELVAHAAAAGLTTIAVTDHDTMSAVPAARAAAEKAGVRVVPGIEITAVQDERDVHILGYFMSPDNAELTEFLEGQRADRRRRIAEILDRLEALGVPVSGAGLVDNAAVASGRALGRPLVARALIDAGHADDMADAFERYLAHGRPAFVPRRGAAPGDVITLVARAGGLTSFAHPGKAGLDGLIPDLARAGLSALEAFHPDHAKEDVERYRRLARDLNLAMTGGSDYHGPGTGRVDALGRVVLPPEHFAGFEARRPQA